nr:ribonuclease R [Deinococcus psychrotolerans]
MPRKKQERPAPTDSQVAALPVPIAVDEKSAEAASRSLQQAAPRRRSNATSKPSAEVIPPQALQQAASSNSSGPSKKVPSIPKTNSSKIKSARTKPTTQVEPLPAELRPELTAAPSPKPQSKGRKSKVQEPESQVLENRIEAAPIVQSKPAKASKRSPTKRSESAEVLPSAVVSESEVTPAEPKLSAALQRKGRQKAEVQAKLPEQPAQTVQAQLLPEPVLVEPVTADAPPEPEPAQMPVTAGTPKPKAANRQRRTAKSAVAPEIELGAAQAAVSLPQLAEPEPLPMSADEQSSPPKRGKRRKVAESAPEAQLDAASTIQPILETLEAAPSEEAEPVAAEPALEAQPPAEGAPGEPDLDAAQIRRRERTPKGTRLKRGERPAVAVVDALPESDAQVTQPQHAETSQLVQVSAAHAVSPEAKELIIEQLRKLGRPVHVRDFERTFTRQGRERLGVRRDLAGLLEDLTLSGDVIRTRRHTYGLPEAMNLVRGRFQASTGGFGFVIPDSGGDDFYIREGETLEAWNGDIVLIRPEGRNGGNDRYERGGGGNRSRRDSSPRAAVVRIVSRAYSQLVGSLDHQATYAFLKPDDHRARHRIMLMPDGTEGLPNGARVVTQLFWPEDTGEDEVYGEIVRVLGNEDDPATETQAVIVKYGLRDEFPPEVLEEAERIPLKLPDSALRERLDLRDYHIFTVDGSDAKDFDDAIHIQATPEGTFVVGIHIADVSHYVQPGTAIDEEAYARATSVYLPGAVLPMLPEHLSNGVCSLVEGEDRLTMSAMIELSGDGEVLSTAFTPSVIRSKARLTYDEVQAYSEAVATLQGSARILEGDLHLLLKITAKLRQKRLREGSLDFKLREVKVDVDKDGHMQLIPLREETARGMIEDLMLLANKAVAHFLLEKNAPTLFRIHEEPTMARFQEVSAAIGRMGLAFPGGEPTPQAYQSVLKAVRGTSQESVVNTLLLRSMQQAKYAEENLGHFGLAFEEYLHFTSPIRRYPDLLVHRALKAALSGPVTDRVRAELAAPLTEQGRHTSERERNASDAERDLTKYYQAKWAQEHLDESFEGRVSGVIASGLFVVLENGVEGRLHISNLGDDYYFYIEDASILKGRTSGRIYRIGENIDVTISGVNPLARQIDFTQAEQTQENSMDGNDNRPRARRREDRETQKREKLSSFLPRKNGEAEPQAAPDDVQEPQDQAQSAQSRSTQSVQPSQPMQSARREQGSGPRRDSPRNDTSRNDTSRSDSPRSDSARTDTRSERPRQGGVQSGTQNSSGPRTGGYRRRVVTLDRPRNEHLRPVNVTVQRMYFGDWTLENMPPDEGPGREQGSYRSGGAQQFRGRSQSGAGAGPRSDTPRNTRQPRNEAQSQRLQPAASATAAGATGDTAESAADEARRRRRRRGRRGGNGPS